MSNEYFTSDEIDQIEEDAVEGGEPAFFSVDNPNQGGLTLYGNEVQVAFYVEEMNRYENREFDLYSYEEITKDNTDEYNWEVVNNGEVDYNLHENWDEFLDICRERIKENNNKEVDDNVI